VDGSVDPIRDAETIETELLLADLESIDRQVANIERKAKGGDKDIKAQYEFMKRVKEVLDDGKPARIVIPENPDELRWNKQLGMLTAKPILYVCNVNESDASSGNQWSEKVALMASGQGAQSVVICAAIEAEIAQLETKEEKEEFLSDMGLSEAGLDRIIRAGYELLNLQTYFTAGPKESRAWTVRKGARAPEAAGAIHTDFEKGFIKAEVISFTDYTTLGGEQAAKDQGRMRQEGKEYVVLDGDVILFRFNV
jgi:GTP-binding protein YchF